MRIVVIALLFYATLAHAGECVQKSDGLIPGLYQVRTGQRTKGLVIGLTQSVTAAGGLFAWRSSENLEDKIAQLWETYDALPAGLPAADYDRAFDAAKSNEEKASDRDNIAKRFLWGAAGVYVFNLLDVALYDQQRATAFFMPLSDNRIFLLASIPL
jgi:hypothetical protein